MGYKLSQRSLDRLRGVRPPLVKVVKRALELSKIDFSVLEGVRSVEKQKHLLAIGASKIMDSRHLTGHAVDLGAYVDGEIRWDWPLYRHIAHSMLLAADELGVDIVWGGDWNDDGYESDEKGLRDGPHFELKRSKYPS